MKLEVNGSTYENFTAASAELRLDALSNTFQFQAVSTERTPLPFRGGEACKVLVDDEVVVTGFIEVVSGNYSSGDHSISVQGRDKTGDLLDSTLASLSDIRSPITLKAIIERIISGLGGGLTVIDKASPEIFNEAEDIAAPEDGENAFDFIEALARKRQVLLTSDSEGNVVIEKTPGVDSGNSIQNTIGDSNNNVISASFSYDTTGRYNVYRFASALNPIALNKAGNVSLAAVVNQNGAIIDTGIRPGRQLVLISEDAFSDEQNDSRAIWEANVRKARGRVYTCTVLGYRGVSGNLWAPNTLVQIIDDFAGIVARMLINSVEFNFSLQGGRTTTLTFVEENAYTLTLSEPDTQEVGNGFL